MKAIVAAEEVLPSLKRFISGCETDNQIYACWILANCLRLPRQIRSFRQGGIFPPLIEMLKGGDWKAKHLATQTIYVALFEADEYDVRYLVDRGCITALCDLLIVPDKDCILLSVGTQIVVFALRSLERILFFGAEKASEYEYGEENKNRMAAEITEAGGESKIEEIAKQSGIATVRDEAEAILNRYFKNQEGGVANYSQEGGEAIAAQEGWATVVVNEGSDDGALQDGVGTDAIERLGSSPPSSRRTL